MFRMVFTAGCRLSTAISSRYLMNVSPASSLLQHSAVEHIREHFCRFGTAFNSPITKQCKTLFSTLRLNIPSIAPQVRTVIKFSLRKGKRKSNKAVLKRFFRLHWGGWIRTKAGRHKRLWRKSGKNRLRLKQHVFCTTTQSYLLDKMVTKYWRTPKYYVDDPYTPYHSREEFPLTQRKPKPS